MGFFNNLFNQNSDMDDYQKKCLIEFDELKKKVKADVEDEKIFDMLKQRLITFLSRCATNNTPPKGSPRKTVYTTCAFSIETIVRQQINKLSENECRDLLLIFSHIIDVYPQWGDKSFLESRMADMLEIVVSKYQKTDSNNQSEIDMYKQKIEELEYELSIKEGMIKRALKDVTFLKNKVLEQKSNDKEIKMLRECVHNYRFNVRTKRHMFSEPAKDTIDKLYNTLHLLKEIQDEMDNQIIASQKRYEEISEAKERLIQQEERKLRGNRKDDGVKEMLISWDRSDIYAAHGEVEFLKAHHDFLAYLFDCIDKIKPIVIEDRYHNRKLGVSDDD